MGRERMWQTLVGFVLHHWKILSFFSWICCHRLAHLWQLGAKMIAAEKLMCKFQPFRKHHATHAEIGLWLSTFCLPQASGSSLHLTISSEFSTISCALFCQKKQCLMALAVSLVKPTMLIKEQSKWTFFDTDVVRLLIVAGFDPATFFWKTQFKDGVFFSNGMSFFDGVMISIPCHAHQTKKPKTMKSWQKSLASSHGCIDDVSKTMGTMMDENSLVLWSFCWTMRDCSQFLFGFTISFPRNQATQCHLVRTGCQQETICTQWALFMSRKRKQLEDCFLGFWAMQQSDSMSPLGKRKKEKDLGIKRC